MNIEKRSAQIGAAILILSVLLRITGGVLSPQARAEGMTGFFQDGFLLHLPSKGVSVTQKPSTYPTTTPSISTVAPSAPVTTMPTVLPSTVPTVSTIPTIPTAPTIPTTPVIPALPAMIFTAEDMQYVRVRYATDCTVRTDLQTALLRPIQWQLQTDQPTVLIVHSHASESFTKQPGEDYQQSSEYRTLNTDYNMVAVGDLLTAQLQSLGISVLHDRQIHDYPSYSQAYANSRKSVEAYLQEYPSIQIVLDLHRDSALDADGKEYATYATVDGQRSAQIMLLAGSDASGATHPTWERNLSLALKLQVLLERDNPGITRQTLMRGKVFNQDLCEGMLIVEVGLAGNTLTEAMRTIPPLAKAVAALSSGACTS